MKINRTTGPLLSYIALAAGAYFILTNMNNKKDPTKPTVAPTPRQEKNPAFTYGKGETLDDGTEGRLIKAIFTNRGLQEDMPLMKDGSKMTEEVYQSLLADIDEAIAYYPNRPQKNLEKIRGDLVQYKDQIVAKSNGVGMGPISGFGGVY